MGQELEPNRGGLPGLCVLSSNEVALQDTRSLSSGTSKKTKDGDGYIGCMSVPTAWETDSSEFDQGQDPALEPQFP